MTYEDSGFDRFFQRGVAPKRIEVGVLPDIPSFDLDSILQEISGSKIRSGIIESKDGKLKIDLETGKISYNDGVVDLFVLGGDDKEMTLKNTDGVVELDEEP